MPHAPLSVLDTPDTYDPTEFPLSRLVAGEFPDRNCWSVVLLYPEEVVITVDVVIVDVLRATVGMMEEDAPEAFEEERPS